MTDVSRLLRGALPLLVALPVATAFALPASAAPPAPAAQPTRVAQWWLTALHAPGAWRAVPGEGKGVIVAVLSTGVAAAHRDLAGAVATGPDYSASGRTAVGPFWGSEGTAVASLIAGHGHGAGGAVGITGIAPRARVLSVRVTLEYNDPLNADAAVARRLPAAIAAGIRYAVARGASVIALPLDPGTLGPAATGDPAAAGGSAAERAAVSYALGRGVALVAPAGDNGAGTGTDNYPAAYPGVIAVGATVKNGGLAPYTSTRSYVALTAPGSGLTAAAPGGGYDSLASTDMSSALAAGVAALIRARFPRLTPAEVAQALERGTAKPGAPTEPGTGHRGRHRRHAPRPLAARVTRRGRAAGGPPCDAPPDRAALGLRGPGGSGATRRGAHGLRADRGAGGCPRSKRRAPSPRARRRAVVAAPADRAGRQPRPAAGDGPRRAAGGFPGSSPAPRTRGRHARRQRHQGWRRRTDRPHVGRAHAAHGADPRQAQGDRRAAVGARQPAADPDASRLPDGPAGRAGSAASGRRTAVDRTR